jgi:hypothetical protein
MRFMRDRSSGSRWTLSQIGTWQDDEPLVREHMSTLAERFPCLAGKPGVRPWDPAPLDRWAHAETGSAEGLHAARFILNVWDSKRAWRCGRFDLPAALDHWDPVHREAFTSWMKDPWWPLSLHAVGVDEESMPDSLPRAAG